MKLLGTFASSQLQVATVLTASWNPLAGAPAEIVSDVKNMIGDDGMYDPQCALEVRYPTITRLAHTQQVYATSNRWPLLQNQRRFWHHRLCRP